MTMTTRIASTRRCRLRTQVTNRFAAVSINLAGSILAGACKLRARQKANAGGLFQTGVSGAWAL